MPTVIVYCELDVEKVAGSISVSWLSECKTPAGGRQVAVPNRTAFVGVRTTPARKLIWQEAAQLQGMRLSEWLRRVADRDARESVREPGS